MLEIAKSNNELPSIPGKRYFTISEMGDLCSIKPHVLRYWEQEFPQLRPIKRRGNRRYYQRQDVVLVRQIRSLLYDHGFTIGGAKQKLLETNSLNNKQLNNELISELRSELETLLKILN
jgi:DNA-binding transcriptional MerR regulator